MIVDELLKHIFSGGDLSSPAFSRWIKSSERFKVFAEKYRNKIRKKVTGAQKDSVPDEKLKDVLFELEMAYLMLKDGRFLEVEYEKYREENERGPDFTVTYETGTVFNVEVRRIWKP